MSLYLPDQKLGAKSQPDSSSHKFMLKGRQTGTMHRGHGWVFRAESYDTMLAWYDDIKSLTEKTGEDRNNFVRRHTRSFSRNSVGSASSLEEDEADSIPYSASHHSLTNGDSLNQSEMVPQRPQPGGRFPSDIQDRKNLPDHLSASSNSSFDQELSTVAGGYQIRPTDRPSGSMNEMQPTKTHDAPSIPPLWTQESLYHHESSIMSRRHPLDDPPAQDSSESRYHDQVNEKFLATAALTSTKVSAEQHHSLDRQETAPPTDSRAVQPSVINTESAIDSTVRQPTPPLTETEAIHQPPRIETIAPVAVPIRSGQSTSRTIDSKAQSDVPEVPAATPLLRRGTDMSASNLHIPGEYPSASA
jgi:hypothetical protein